MERKRRGFTKIKIGGQMTDKNKCCGGKKDCKKDSCCSNNDKKTDSKSTCKGNCKKKNTQDKE